MEISSRVRGYEQAFAKDEITARFRHVVDWTRVSNKVSSNDSSRIVPRDRLGSDAELSGDSRSWIIPLPRVFFLSFTRFYFLFLRHFLNFSPPREREPRPHARGLARARSFAQKFK